MTYIDYINQFWKIQRTEDFSPNDVLLYFFLLNECNLRGWPNKFEYPNRRIVLATGMAEKTVIACRCRLQQKGLIEFESGKRNAKSPVYYLLEVSKEVSKEVSLNNKSKENKSKEEEEEEEKESSTNVEQKKAEERKKLAAAKAATIKRRDEFYKSLIPYVERYGAEMIRAFYDYWSELNKSETKMKYELNKTWELGKRLATWAKNDYNGERKNNAGIIRSGSNDRRAPGRSDAENKRAERDRLGQLADAILQCSSPKNGD
ncbi:MAG: hypothetical protein LBV32_10920 [Tannerellaceae bacterium]|jgi:hypothetical protein|nr:hypothetical protein [Tannerellaceae bacterium]